MDGRRFDQLARTVAAASSRRGLLAGVAGALAAGLFAAGADDADAAGACRVCRRGRCVTRPDGARCAQCGACDDGVCVPSGRYTCGPCRECNTATMRCDPLPDDFFCGDCGLCERGNCRPHDELCPACATCRGARFAGPTFSCRSDCEEGARCCPDDTCAPVDGCCPDETRCDDDCCAETETCTADGCCQASRVCGSGPSALCCDEGAVCLDGLACCPLGQVCTDPVSNNSTCCAADLVCCASDFTCKPPDECCADCNECQTCENGECVADPTRELADCGTTGCGVCQGGRCANLSNNSDCTDRLGVCCDGLCLQSDDACCDDAGCAECQTCDFGECIADPDKTGLTCGTSGCQVCGDGQCVNLSDNSACTDRAGICCSGRCCAAGETCCGGQCRAGGCDCPPGQSPCPDQTCCPEFDYCTRNGCCDPTIHSACCSNPNNSIFDCQGPCCDGATERCCENPLTADAWCCPKGVDCAGGHSCCPIDMPRAWSLSGGLYCCPRDAIQLPEECSQTLLPGRRS